MSTPRKTKRPVLGIKPIAYGWAITNEKHEFIYSSRGLPFVFRTRLDARGILGGSRSTQIRVAIVPVTRGKKKARAK